MSIIRGVIHAKGTGHCLRRTIDWRAGATSVYNQIHPPQTTSDTDKVLVRVQVDI